MRSTSGKFIESPIKAATKSFRTRLAGKGAGAQLAQSFASLVLWSAFQPGRRRCPYEAAEVPINPQESGPKALRGRRPLGVPIQPLSGELQPPVHEWVTSPTEVGHPDRQSITGGYIPQGYKTSLVLEIAVYDRREVLYGFGLFAVYRRGGQNLKNPSQPVV